ncbi:MAG: hypothetical protein OXD34_13910 [bacterium]|nr:hypothetical protein [bacterium]
MKCASALAGVLLVLAACGGTGTGPFETVQGAVLEVNGDLESIESFVLRTDDGEVIEVVPAPDGDFRFPLAHLHDHRRTLEPLSVGLDRSVDPPLAVAIRDAGSDAWHGGESHAETTTTPSVPQTTGAVTTAPAPSITTGTSSAPTSTTAVVADTTTTVPPTTEAGPGGPVIDLVITDGSVEGGVRRESVRIGETVTLRVGGNTSDEVHVHGYDIYIHLEEGQGQLTFEASIPGVFEVELERTHTLVLQLEVS